MSPGRTVPRALLAMAGQPSAVQSAPRRDRHHPMIGTLPGSHGLPTAAPFVTATPLRRPVSRRGPKLSDTRTRRDCHRWPASRQLPELAAPAETAPTCRRPAPAATAACSGSRRPHRSHFPAAGSNKQHPPPVRQPTFLPQPLSCRRVGHTAPAAAAARSRSRHSRRNRCPAAGRAQHSPRQPSLASRRGCRRSALGTSPRSDHGCRAVGRRRGGRRVGVAATSGVSLGRSARVVEPGQCWGQCLRVGYVALARQGLALCVRDGLGDRGGGVVEERVLAG